MGNKKKLDIISISSDDDDVPLKAIKTVTGGLKTYSQQQCEFCDAVFFNRYDALLHNAKHIIIPLLKQAVHQCTECLFHFTSQQELQHHMKQKHNKHESERVQHKREVSQQHNVLDIAIATKECIVKLDKLDIIKIKKNGNLKIESPAIETKNKISNRLTFEDDTDMLSAFEIDSMDLLKDFTTECKVAVNLFDEPWVDDIIKQDASTSIDDNSQKIDEVMVGDDGLDETSEVMVSDDAEKSNDINIDDDEMGDEEYVASTHFDELVKPGMYKCKRCQQIFPTRYNLIQHDMTHVRIRKPRPLLCTFCERFISNNRVLLQQHINRKHRAEMQSQSRGQKLFKSCKRCGLKYHNYTKHMNNYHSLKYCHLCNEGFDTEEERLNHIRGHLVETKCMHCDLVSTSIEIHEHQRLFHRVSNVSTIKICEMCCLFLKNKHNMQYVFIENVSGVGTRLGCDRCGKQFFELKLVRRLHKKKEKEIQFEGEKEKKKPLTNSDRLKHIQQRLKMINKLSRF